MRNIVFYAASIMAIASALLCITRKSPVAAALWLVNVLFNLSVVYVLLDAHFIAAVQVLVYAGAIMVLFLFVIMLLNVGNLGASDVKGPAGKVIAAAAGLILIAEIVALGKLEMPASAGLPDGAVARMVEQQGAIQVIAEPLFTRYLIPFELTSVMLLAALVGAVVLAKRKI
jgi:NADH-quinone oxidoreductase subunit J